jgi:hypothetical protein
MPRSTWFRLPQEKNCDAKLSDASALATLMCELGYETTTAEMRQRLKSILTNARLRTFVAEIDGVICGMIGTLAHPTLTAAGPTRSG